MLDASADAALDLRQPVLREQIDESALYVEAQRFGPRRLETCSDLPHERRVAIEGRQQSGQSHRPRI